VLFAYDGVLADDLANLEGKPFTAAVGRRVRLAPAAKTITENGVKSGCG
jgi:hypothetical protein